MSDLSNFQQTALDSIEAVTDETIAAKLPADWPKSQAEILTALRTAGLPKGSQTNTDAKTLWDLRPVDTEAHASASVNVTATMAAASEPVNEWLAQVDAVGGDDRMTAYAGATALNDDTRLVLERIGKLDGMTTLDQSGLRAAVIGVAQLAADGTSKRKLPMKLADLIYTWWRLVSKKDSSIMDAEERLSFAKEVAGLVHPDLQAMLNVAVIAKSGRSNMKAMGAGSAFDVGKFGSLGPEEIAIQLPDVLKLAADKAMMSFVLQKYGVFAEEYEKYLYPIVESREFQTLCGITPAEDPRMSVAEALESAGYPLASAAFRATLDAQKLWNFLKLCPVNGDANYVLALGEIGALVVRDNAQVKRVVESMESKEVVAGAEAAAQSFRHADAHVRAVAAPRPPQGLSFFGLRILVTADAGVRVTRE